MDGKKRRKKLYLLVELMVLRHINVKYNVIMGLMFINKSNWSAERLFISIIISMNLTTLMTQTSWNNAEGTRSRIHSGTHISLLIECLFKAPLDLGLSFYLFFSICFVLLKSMVFTGFFLNFARSSSERLTRTFVVLFLDWTNLPMESLWRLCWIFIDLFWSWFTRLVKFSAWCAWPKE